MNIASNINRQLQQKILDTIQAKHLIEQGDVVVIGVSGGPDSVCLLHILHSLSSRLDTRLHAIHINHMLRAEEAQADEAYAAELCKELGIPLSVVRADVAAMAKKLGMSLEEAGREARYQEFERCADSVGAAKIAVAHNRNDQAETVMMHIIRGTGTAGLVGMEYRRGVVIRPLLNVYRKEIEQYCKEAGLLPRTDSSNLERDFARNRIRLDLFPYINENFGTDITESLCRLSSHAADDNSYLEQCALEAYEGSLKTKSIGRVSLNQEQLRKLHPAILARVLKHAVCDAAGNSNGVGSVHYRALSDLVAKGNTGARAELPRGLGAAVSYGILNVFIKMPQLQNPHNPQKPQKQHQKASQKPAAFDINLTIPGSTQVQELDAVIKTSVEKVIDVDKCGRMGYNSFVQFFDYDSLSRGINIRNRRDGDIFKPFRSNGTKKLKKYFIDSKIPRELRDEIPLICINNEVVWVVGYKISDKFKVTENTKSILKIEYNRRASL